VPGVGHTARLDQQQLDLALGIGLVGDALGHDEHLARADAHRAVAKVDAQLALDHHEGLVGLLVIVPDEITLQLHDLELVVVHLGDHPGLPVIAEQAEFLSEVDRLIGHAMPP